MAVGVAAVPVVVSVEEDAEAWEELGEARSRARPAIRGGLWLHVGHAPLKLSLAPKTAQRGRGERRTRVAAAGAGGWRAPAAHAPGPCCSGLSVYQSASPSPKNCSAWPVTRKVKSTSQASPTCAFSELVSQPRWCWTSLVRRIMDWCTTDVPPVLHAVVPPSKRGRRDSEGTATRFALCAAAPPASATKSAICKVVQTIARGPVDQPVPAGLSNYVVRISHSSAALRPGSVSAGRTSRTEMTSERRGGRVRRVDEGRRRRERTPYDRPQSKDARRRDSARQRAAGAQAAAVEPPAGDSTQQSPSTGRRSVLGGITTFVSSLIFGSPTQRRGPGAAASSPAWKVSPSSFRFSVGNGSPGTHALLPRSRLGSTRPAAHTFRALSPAPVLPPLPHPQPPPSDAPRAVRTAMPHPVRATARTKRAVEARR